jgi:hypothetical protein
MGSPSLLVGEVVCRELVTGGSASRAGVRVDQRLGQARHLVEKLVVSELSYGMGLSQGEL